MRHRLHALFCIAQRNDGTELEIALSVVLGALSAPIKYSLSRVNLPFDVDDPFSGRQ